MPGGHGRGDELPSGQYEPATHGSGSIVAAVRQREPAGHFPAHVSDVWFSDADEPSKPAAQSYGKSSLTATPSGTVCTNLSSNFEETIQSHDWMHIAGGMGEGGCERT